MGLQEIADRAAAYTEANRQAAAMKELEKATKKWTLPMVLRTYSSNGRGTEDLGRESAILMGHGYDASVMTEEGGHIHVGRLLLTGGLSVLAGKRGIRAGGKHSIMWKRVA